jgi:hypothetical protein
MWYTPVTSTLRSERTIGMHGWLMGLQSRFKASLGCKARPCLKKTKTNKKKLNLSIIGCEKLPVWI